MLGVSNKARMLDECDEVRMMVVSDEARMLDGCKL